MKPRKPISARCVEQLWTPTSLNSVTGAGNISVLISMGRTRLVLSLIPTILGITTVKLAWTIYFYAESVADTGQGMGGRAWKITSVENAQMMGILRVTNPHQVACGEGSIHQVRVYEINRWKRRQSKGDKKILESCCDNIGNVSHHINHTVCENRERWEYSRAIGYSKTICQTQL